MGFLHELYLSEDENTFFNKYGFIARERHVINRTVDFHWHDYFELEIVTDGTGTHFINNNKFPLSCGSAFLLTPSDLHSITGFDDFKVLNICFRGDLLPEKINNFILSNNNLECNLSESELSYILKQIDVIKNINTDFLFDRELVTNIISQIILQILEKTTLTKNVKTSSLTQKTISFMMKNFKKDITLFEVSKEFSVTPKHLGAVFKKSMGISFHEYLNNLRLKFACKLLTSSDISVKEVAFASGYNSVEHFLYVFKKHLKTTPKAFKTF